MMTLNTPMPRPAIRFGATVLDTPDPKGLSSFYADLLGWSVDPDDDSEDWVTIRSADGARMGFSSQLNSRRPPGRTRAFRSSSI
jgi:catechol-2,3-dioxygenase